jgi:hypothetical protein
MGGDVNGPVARRRYAITPESNPERGRAEVVLPETVTPGKPVAPLLASY